MFCFVLSGFIKGRVGNFGEASNRKIKHQIPPFLQSAPKSRMPPLKDMSEQSEDVNSSRQNMTGCHLLILLTTWRERSISLR